ncbi:hypothetical protein APHAL10511_007464, partial [Amanita phalloides]
MVHQSSIFNHRSSGTETHVGCHLGIAAVYIKSLENSTLIKILCMVHGRKTKKT